VGRTDDKKKSIQIRTPPPEAQPPSKSVSEKLMEIAELRHISATAHLHTVLTADKEKQYDFSPQVLSAEQDSDRKQYIPLFINNFRIIALVDSGCDLTLIQKDLLQRSSLPSQGGTPKIKISN
jgi:hypothetical protein